MGQSGQNDQLDKPEKGGWPELHIRVGEAHSPLHVKIALQTVFDIFFYPTHERAVKLKPNDRTLNHFVYGHN